MKPQFTDWTMQPVNSLVITVHHLAVSTCVLLAYLQLVSTAVRVFLSMKWHRFIAQGVEVDGSRSKVTFKFVYFKSSTYSWRLINVRWLRLDVLSWQVNAGYTLTEFTCSLGKLLRRANDKFTYHDSSVDNVRQRAAYPIHRPLSMVRLVIVPLKLDGWQDIHQEFEDKPVNWWMQNYRIDINIGYKY